MGNARKEMTSQKDMVLKHLKLYGSITPKEAMDMYGIMRLSAIIFDLKEENWWIKTEMVTAKNRFNKNTKFAKYTMAIEEELL